MLYDKEALMTEIERVPERRVSDVLAYVRYIVWSESSPEEREADEERKLAEWREFIDRTWGSCVDPTMIEHPEIPFEYDVPRRFDLL
ncbi:MAG: hypothetical protein FWB74_03270 [Defluviitaleaceae bacterium]|nr:hypothetical protein [Defluviitaleaceae bacterium]